MGGGDYGIGANDGARATQKLNHRARFMMAPKCDVAAFIDLEIGLIRGSGLETAGKDPYAPKYHSKGQWPTHISKHLLLFLVYPSGFYP
jgi:hypothetical protein